MLRNVAMVAIIGVLFVGGLPFIPILLLIRLINKRVVDYIILRYVQFVIICIVNGVARTKTTVIGMENIPKDKAVLFVGNHRSYFDILVSYKLFSRPTGFVAKQELGKVPVFNLYMWLLNCLFLDRKDIRKGMKTILHGVELMKSGVSLVIFPEGTRNTTDSITLPFHEGSMKLAEKSGCLIIPMVQCNTAECYEKTGRVKPTHTILEFGEPIDPATLSKEERKHTGAYVQKRIEEIYTRNLAKV